MLKTLVMGLVLMALGCEGVNETPYRPAPKEREICDFTVFIARISGVDFVFVTDHWERMAHARESAHIKTLLDPDFFCQANTEYTEESFSIAYEAWVPTTHTNLQPDYWAEVYAWFLAEGDGSARVWALLTEKPHSFYPRLDVCPPGNLTDYLSKNIVQK